MIMLRSILVACCFLAASLSSAYDLPFTTSGSSIVDARGNPVRMKCVNWPATMESMLPEGLQHNSIENIVRLIQQMNMTCVRLTYSIDLARSTDLTAYRSLEQLNLTSALAGFQLNNPMLINSTVSEVFNAVLDTLGKYDVLVLLDNHLSKAMWCCGELDGNGFWGDRYFDVETWLDGVRRMAGRTLDRPHVIAMSLRNELRGLRQNEPEWYRNVLRGIREAISLINPRLLIVVSGLHSDLSLSFIRTLSIQELVPQSIKNQIVYEAHWYSWSGYGLSTECDKIKAGIHHAWGFIREPNQRYTAPVWLTEFGLGIDNFTGNDTYINCVQDFLQLPLSRNMSWSYWVLAGSYYVRSGAVESHETFGLLTDDWKSIKSPLFVKLLSTM